MFHLPGCPAALGSRDWVVAVLLTAATASGCTAWVLCAFLLLWSNFAEAKRAWKSQRLFASSPVPGPLIAENSLAARQEQRAGPGCLNRISASISGASAGVRLPDGAAAG